MRKINYLDLFSGIGGFHLGLQQAGINFNKVFYSEIDKYCNQIYERRFPDAKPLGSVEKIKTGSLPRIHLVTFGFPCQDLSVAGKRGGIKAARSGLFFEAMRIVRATKPDYFIFENVKGLLSSKGGRDFKIVLQTIADSGYDGQWQLLNTRWFLPQNRERIYFVGYPAGRSRPEIFPVGEDVQGVAQRTGKTTNIRTLQGGGHSGGHHSGMTLISPTIRAEQHNTEDVHFVSIQRLSQEGKARNHGKISPTIQTPSGGGHLPMIVQPCLTPDREKKRQHGRRFKENGEPMFTLTGQDIHGVAMTLDCDGYLRTTGKRPRDKDGNPQLLPIGYRRLRRLTPIECERLQGFPDNWTEGLSNTQRYKSLGNAVSIPVVEAIGARLLKVFERINK